jgi:hypothetical protein
VLLDTGSAGRPYPYFVLCRRQNGQWVEYGGSNMSSWYRIEDDNGVVVYWDDADSLPQPVEVMFKGKRWTAQVSDGVLWAVWWDELSPGNLIEPNWPELVTKTIWPGLRVTTQSHLRQGASLCLARSSDADQVALDGVLADGGAEVGCVDHRSG